jgi:hypothetical protein
MFKIGFGLIVIYEIGNGGGGVIILGGKINLVLHVISFGINIKRKSIYFKLKELT